MKLITTATLVVSTLLVHGTIIFVRAGENTIRGGGDNGDGDRPSQSSSSSSSGQRDLAPVYLLEQPLFGYAEGATKCGNKECPTDKPNCCTTVVRGSTVPYCTDRACSSSNGSSIGITEFELQSP